ncbi:MAG TPA: hypothetical protein VJB87_01650, partial [Candidatus Nanoarchaeia archaeon]|nr:hypothetical protein [Candidatus Nanoarchaeia archaeon]
STSLNFRNSNASTIVNASMSQKLHKWKAQCVDAFGIGANSSVVRDLTVDSSPPAQINLTLNATFTFNKNAHLTCDTVDSIDNATNVSLYVQSAGLSSSRLVANVTSNNLTFDFTDTGELGFYKVNCTVMDYTGNQNSSVMTFEIIKGVSTQKYIPKVENQPIAKKLVGSGKTVDIGVLDVSDARLMAKSATLLFTVNGEAHSLMVKEIAADEVVLVFTSEPQEVRVKVGGVEQVDLNGDGVNDVSITLHGVFRAKADLELVNLRNAPVVGEIPTVEEPSVVEESSSLPAGTGKTVLIVLIVLAVILVAGYLWVRFRPRGGVSFNDKDLGAGRSVPPPPSSPMYPRSAPLGNVPPSNRPMSMPPVNRSVQPLTYKAKPLQSSNQSFSNLPYNSGNSRFVYKRYPER